MRLGIIADIHANAEALDAVVGAGARRGIDEWICLGDTVGYGAAPAACLEGVRALCQVVLLGNHDAAVAGLLEVDHFNPAARAAVRWTAEQLGAAERRYLASLPLTHARAGACFVHADPRRPSAWGYIADVREAGRALSSIAAALCFVGHAHVAFACGLRAGRAVLRAAGPGLVALDEGERYLVNVGSVGQPRDGDWRASFALWDQERGTVELMRCPYDVARAQREIRAAGLPDALAARLASGR